MKIFVFAVLFLMLGAALGGGITWWEFDRLDNWYTSDGQPLDSGSQTDDQFASAPRVVVVNGEKHDFGAQERYTDRSHVFVIKNEGAAPLELTRGETTCSCTLSDATDTTLASGEQIEIKLSWQTKLDGNTFSQSADVHTNDPRRKLVRLSISGRVVDSLSVEPQEVTFTNKPAHEPSEARLKVLSMREGELVLGAPEFTHLPTASYFDVALQPMTAEDLSKELDAKSGYWLVVTAKSGLPLGSINQTIQIPTRIDGQAGEKVRFAIDGNVVGDIRLLSVGKTLFLPDQNRLLINIVHRDKGIVVPMKLLVTGPHRDAINLRIGRVDPENVLKASLGAVKKVSEGKTHIYEFKVEIPKGSPLINRSGSKDAPPGVVIIESDHPDSPTFKLFVEFAVEG